MSRSLLLEAGLYLFILLLICYWDLKIRRIPNKLLLCLVVLRASFLIYFFTVSAKDGFSALLSSGSAALSALIALFFFRSFLQGRTGAGDFKLLIAAGFCFGLELFGWGLCATILLLVPALVNQAVRKQASSIPFAPFLCAGLLITFLLSWIAG